MNLEPFKPLIIGSAIFVACLLGGVGLLALVVSLIEREKNKRDDARLLADLERDRV